MSIGNWNMMIQPVTQDVDSKQFMSSLLAILSPDLFDHIKKGSCIVDPTKSVLRRWESSL